MTPTHEPEVANALSAAATDPSKMAELEDFIMDKLGLSQRQAVVLCLTYAGFTPAALEQSNAAIADLTFAHAVKMGQATLLMAKLGLLRK